MNEGNLTPFKKGQSGNPKGRPKLPDLKEVFSEILGKENNGKTGAQEIVEVVFELAKKGNMQAVNFLFDRPYGTPKQTTELISDKTEGERACFRLPDFIDENGIRKEQIIYL